jgi:catechol 1,2-dioxygenase
VRRRKFIKQTTMVAIGIGFFGKIAWSNGRFVGDRPTTTDVLGPFYRLGAPVRININPSNYTGNLFHVAGTVYKEDGKTPFANARVEVWQCDENRQYDNHSDEFRNRGTQFSDTNGKYHFICMHPIPYPVAGQISIMRPAHIHMLIAAEGQQDLITQIYLQGDPHLENDPAASLSDAVKRILPIYTNEEDQQQSVQFDIVMAKQFIPSDAVFAQLAGLYKMNDQSTMELVRENDLLLCKWNGQFREGLSYKGNNQFAGGVKNVNTLLFENGVVGEVKIKFHYKSFTEPLIELEGVKVL